MPRFRKLLHGIRKRFKPRKGQTATADNSFDGVNDGDGTEGHTHSTGSAYHVPPNSVVSSSPPPPSRSHQVAENQYSNSSSGGDSHYYNNNTEKHQPPSRSAPLLPRADPKLAPSAKNESGLNKSSVEILHDRDGYALVLPKSGKNGKPRNSSSGQNESTAAYDADNNKDVKVGVKMFVFPTKPNGKSEVNPQVHTKSRADDKTKANQADTGAYCNVVLADDKGTRSFSNELYEDTDMKVPVPKLPENTRTVAMISDAPENSKNSQLNYIEVEFVKPTEVTSKRPLMAKRSNSPTEYTDVISENGVVRLVD